MIILLGVEPVHITEEKGLWLLRGMDTLGESVIVYVYNTVDQALLMEERYHSQMPVDPTECGTVLWQENGLENPSESALAYIAQVIACLEDQKTIEEDSPNKCSQGRTPHAEE